MYADVNHVFLCIFVDSKSSVKSDDEENLMPKTTAKKVSAESVLHLKSLLTPPQFRVSIHVVFCLYVCVNV